MDVILPKNVKKQENEKMDLKSALKLRKKAKKKKPSFQRQEGYRLKKLKKGWRRPKGRHSKLRQKEKARGKHPSPGYSSPKEAHGLSRSGFKVIRISNPKQLSNIDSKNEAVMISGSVGKVKRQLIIETAKKDKIHVLNS